MRLDTIARVSIERHAQLQMNWAWKWLRRLKHDNITSTHDRGSLSIIHVKFQLALDNSRLLWLLSCRYFGRYSRLCMSLWCCCCHSCILLFHFEELKRPCRVYYYFITYS